MIARTGRRAFLRLVAAAGAGSACSSSRGGAVPPPCATDGTGPGIAYCLVANQKLRVTGGARIGVGQVVVAVLDDNTAGILARDARGLYALSATCTHACCTVNVCVDASCAVAATTPGACAAPSPLSPPPGGAAFLCPCHGSEYAVDGSVVRGPATRALPSIAVEVDGNDALVDFSQPVDAAQRA